MRPDNVKPRPRDYEVGYGKPPAHTHFRKGRFGNLKSCSDRRDAARFNYAFCAKGNVLHVALDNVIHLGSIPTTTRIIRSKFASRTVRHRGLGALGQVAHVVSGPTGLETKTRLWLPAGAFRRGRNCVYGFVKSCLRNSVLP